MAKVHPKDGPGFPLRVQWKGAGCHIYHSPNGMVKSLTLLCTAMDTITDLSNAYFICHKSTQPHKLYNLTEEFSIPYPPPPNPALYMLTSYPHLQLRNTRLVAYVDIFVDNFLGLAQRPAHRQRHIWHALFHILYKVFQTLDSANAPFCKKFLPLKKLNIGDCTWYICQVILGWFINMVNITVLFPPPPLCVLFVCIYTSCREIFWKFLWFIFFFLGNFPLIWLHTKYDCLPFVIYVNIYLCLVFYLFLSYHRLVLLMLLSVLMISRIYY